MEPMNDQVSEFATQGEYQQSESGNFGMGLTMLFVGLAAGALIGLLLAPKTGKQMRRSLRRTYEDARGAVEDFSDQAGDWIDKGSEWAEKAKSKVAPLGKPFQR
jgi:gas vesicle protein